MRSNRNTSSQTNSSNELSEALLILSNSGVDIASRKLFLTKMTNQLSCRTLNEALRFNPTLGPPGSAPTRDEIETWIYTLNQYTNYLSSLLSEDDGNNRNDYFGNDEDDEFDSSSQISSDVNADEALEVLINRARNSPRSNVFEKATQTLSPNDKFTQTSSPKKQKYYEKSTSTSKKFSLSAPITKRKQLARSQPSHQSRGIEASPPRDSATQTKSLLAQKIEISPRFLSYNDPDDDVYEGPPNTNTYRSISRGVNTSPTRVYIISPKKKEEGTQTPNSDDVEIDIEYENRSWNRSKPQNWPRRKD